MKKLRLLLAFCALLLGWSNASAQASYNHTYTEGVTVAEGTDYFLYNVGSQMFLTDGMAWGTHATADHAGRKITFAEVSSGKYSIYTQSYSVNNDVEAKAGYMTTNGYLDTGTNDAEWVFTPVSVGGYTNVYTIKHSDTQYLYFDAADCAVNVGESTNNNYSYWIIVPKTARDAVGDYTYYLMNTDMNRPWERKVWAGITDNSQVGGNAANRCAERYHAIVDVSQTIAASVPNGRYKVYAQGFWRQDGSSAGPDFYANSDKNTLGSLTGTENNMTDASNSFSAGKYVNSVETFVSDGKLKVGIDITANNQWVIFDNFTLDYLGQCVMDYAVALPAGGAMAADTWYYFDIAAAADNYNANATTLGDIICTDDGYALTSAASGNVTLNATNNSFAAKRYYVKSSSANNLEIGVASYSYSISEASADVSYIQEGNTVTVSFTASTNDPGATLTQDYSGVTLGGESVSATPTASGFTFTVPEVTVGTEYTLAIPANAIGYAAGSTYNEAQNITLKTPAVFDGTYFLKVAATYDGSSEVTSAAVGKYMARGTAYSTHLSLDSYGLPVAITTDGSNQTILKMADTNGYVFSTGSYDAFADGGSPTYFTLTIQNNKYLIASNNRDGKFLKYNNANVSDEEISVFDDGTGSNNGPIIMWAIESISEHATAMQAKKDNQAATAAAAAYASGNYASLSGITTVSALETELETNYIEGQFVSPSEITSVQESYQPRNNSSGNLVPITVYSNTIDITEAGFYKFSMQAFNRATWNANVQAMHELGADMPAAVLFFGDSETQIKSLYDEVGQATATTTEGGTADVLYNDKYYANGTAAALVMFKDDKYHNDVWFYCSTPGTYTYGVKVMGYAGGQWFIYSPQSVTITSYAAAATSADYTALQNAIDTYDGATWGFETGEYAPYNNVEAINNIDAAKAIDKEAENSKLLVNSLTTKLALTANAGEVNAFYKGDFDGYAEDTSTPLDYTPNGWTATDNFRVMIKNVEDYPGLADASAGTAAMSWSGGITYGETAGYTMPLKANTVYRLQFKAAGWNNETRSGMSVSILNSTDGMALYNLGTPDRDIKGNATNTAGMTSYDVVFATGAAGNYVFHIQSGHNMVVTDFSITKAASQVLEFVDGSAVPAYAPGTYPSVKITRTLTANKWATAVYPFAVSGVDNIAVLDSYNSSTGELVFSTTAGVSTANEPFFMMSTTDKSEITLSDVEVAAPVANPVVTESEASLKGAYTATDITNAEKNYVLSNNEIFSVGAAGATINPYRAYIQLSEAGAARAIRFVVDGQITGVDNVEAATEATLKDGKYLENGKVVIVKNGKKFNATGAQVK